ncbi:beta-ketoacyl synthase, partial [bacterium]|nr:beta-ketoacyl synthase [bacterium]
VVSEKTGYPIEMLDLDLDLEADLGIDTVKQAELFAAIRTHYGIPRRENLILAEYNTLARVIGFVRENLAPVENSLVRAAEDQPQEQSASIDQEVVSKAVASSVENEATKAFVLNLVSEKTGYPVEMLDVELDLEADLGIDTVKQAELFAAVRTHYGIPRREDLILADYNTLAKVIGFVEDAQPGISQSEMVPVQEVTISSESENVIPAIDETTSQPEITVRIPVPVLMPRLDLCDPTGVELKNHLVMIVSDHGKVGTALAKKLKAMGADSLLTSAADLAENCKRWLSTGEIIGAFVLPALDSDPDWMETSFEKWANARKESVETLYELARTLPETAVLIGATRMGGYQGLQETENPMGGLVSGFIKALRRERPQQLSKVIDFEVGASANAIAETLISEALHDPYS